MNKNRSRIGPLRRQEAAARVGPVAYRNVTNDPSAIRSGHVVIRHTPRLQAGAVTQFWFDWFLHRWTESTAAWLRELEARVVQSKTPCCGRQQCFGGGLRIWLSSCPAVAGSRLNGEAGVRPQCCVARPGVPHAHVPCADVYMDRSTGISKSNQCLQKKDRQRASNTAFPIQNGRIQRRK